MAQEFLEFELKAETTKAKTDLKRFEDDINATARRLASKEAIKLSTNVAKIKLEIKQLNEQIKEEIVKAEKSGDFTVAIEMDAKAEVLRQQLTRSKAELRNFARTGDKNISVLGKLFKNISDDINQTRIGILKLWKSTAWLDKIEKELKDIDKQFKKWEINAQQYGKKLNDLQARATKTSGVMGELKKGVASLWVTLVSALWFREFARKLKEASDIAVAFESAFAWVEKTINATDKEFKVINKDLKDLTKILPLTFEELSQIAEVGGQLWVWADNIVSFTTTVAKLGATTTVTAEQVATDFAQISNIINEPIANIDQLGSALVDLGNNFATNEGQILNFSKRIAGAGEIVGLSGAEILGLSTAFTSVGIEAEAGGTAVQKTLLTINDAVNRGGVEMEKFAVIAGKTGEDFKEIWQTDAAEWFTLFVNWLKDAGDDASQVLADLIGSDVRLARAFLSVSNAGDLLNRTIATGTQAYEDNIALQEEFEKRLNTNESKLKIQQNRWRLWGETIGKNVTPQLIKVNGFLLNALPTAFAWLQNALVIFAVFFQEKFIQLSTAVGVFTKNARIMALNVKDFFIILGKNIGVFIDNVGISFGNLGAKMGPGLNKALGKINTWVDKVVGKVNSVLEFFGQKTITPPQIKFNFNDQVQGKKEYYQYGQSIAGIQAKLDKTALTQYKAQKDRQVEINRDALRTNIKNRNQELADLKNLEAQATEERKQELKDEIDEKAKAVSDYLKKLEDLNNDSWAGGGAGSTEQQEALEEEIKALEETKKLIEEKAEENSKTYQAIIWDIEDGVEGLEKYIEGIEEVNDKIQELKDDATGNIRDINNELSEIDSKRDLKIGERYVDILEKEKELKEELRDEDDASERLEIEKELKELARERQIIIENTTEAQRKQAEELGKLTKTEELLADADADKKVLEEKRKIYEAIKNGEEINLEEIQDYKNLKIAEDLTAKKLALDTELASIQANYDSQREALIKLNEEKKTFEAQWTEFFGTEIQKQKDYTDELITKLKRVIALQKEAGINASGFNTSSSSGSSSSWSVTNTSNNRNLNVNITAESNIDIDHAVNVLNSKLK